MKEIGRTKFAPTNMSVGSNAVKTVRIAENNLTVIFHFPNADAAAEEKENFPAIRSQTATELPITILDAKEGKVAKEAEVVSSS